MKTQKRELILYALAWIAILSAVSTRAGEDACKLDTEVDVTTIHVGDLVHLRISAEAPDDMRIVFPGKKADISPFTILDTDHTVEEAGKGVSRETLVLTVSAYEPGDLEIPPITVRFIAKDGSETTRRTDPLLIHVESMLSKEKPEPRDVKSPLSVSPALKYKLRVIGGALAGLLALAALVAFLKKRRREKEAAPPPPPPPRPPHEIALERLKRLREKGLPAPDELKAYFVELTDIFKAFLGARFGFPALELTTGEIRRALPGIRMPEADKHDVIAFLELSDLVKFAKHRPPVEMAMDALERVEKFVRKHKEPAIVPNVNPPADSHEGGA